MTGEQLVLEYWMVNMENTGMAVREEQYVVDIGEGKQVVTVHARIGNYHQTLLTSYHSLRPRRTGVGWRTG